jgi:hypothetical protein
VIDGLRRRVVRVRRHLGWARREGVGRLIEEDQLDPRSRRRMAEARRRWVTEHPGVAPGAQPVFLLGVQRSGTNMLVRGFETSPAFDVANENDARAFQRFRLRPLDDIRRLVESCPHERILMKPLAESHRAIELLKLGTPTPPRAIWAWRNVDDRVRSAVSKFGPNNLLTLRAIASGQERSISVDGPSQEMIELVRDGLSSDALTFVRGLDLEAMDANAGAAAFWYVRNLAFFELGLDRRDDVSLVAYDAMVADPERVMGELCAGLGLGFDEAFIAHMSRRGAGQAERLDLPRSIREACDELTDRLRGVGADAG